MVHWINIVYEGDCAECNEVGEGCEGAEECVGGVCKMPEVLPPCPPGSCTSNDECYDCCVGLEFKKEGKCEEGVCNYESFPCPAGGGCSYEKSCCGTLNAPCCDNNVCFLGLTCNIIEDKCKDSCTEVDTFRCNPNDPEGKKRQKCHEEGGVLTWVDDTPCPLGCDNSTGNCIGPEEGECTASLPCNSVLASPPREFAHAACCSPTSYQVCEVVGDDGMGMPLVGTPCPSGQTCGGIVGDWQIMNSATDTPCVVPCEGELCENPYYECSGENSRHYYCSPDGITCTYDETPCSEGCDSSTGLCKDEVPCGSREGADCCAVEGEECGPGLACNTYGKCEYCGDNGELCCVNEGEEPCREGVCGEDGRCGDCEIFRVRWDSEKEEGINTSVEGQKVFAVVEGSGACYDTGFSLDSLIIYEKGLIFNDEIDFAIGNELLFKNEDDPFKFGWISEIGQGKSDYFFKIVYSEDEKESNDLRVLFCNPLYRKGDDLMRITTCSDYNKVDGHERTQCLADCNGVAVKESTGYLGMQMPACGWVDGKCALTYVDFGDGDGTGGIGNGTGYNCVIEYDQLDECDTGDTHRTVVYRAKELDDSGSVIEGSTNCDAGCGTEICTKQVLCPGIVKMAFFSLFSFVMSLIVIGGIYFVMRRK